MNIKTVIQTVFAVTGSALSWFFGGFDGLFIALTVFIVADYITGVTEAAIRKELSSHVGFVGIAKKIAIFLLVGIANLIDLYIIGEGTLIRNAVLCFYLSNEGISILENLIGIGLPVPDELRAVIAGFGHKKSPDDSTSEQHSADES